MATRTFHNRKKRNPFYSSQISHVSFSATAESSNARTVTITVKDAKNQTKESVTPLRVYLSDVATGADINAAAPSGGIAIGAKGKIAAAIVAGKVLDVLTDVNGQIELTITEATAKTFYVVVVLPDGTVSTYALAFAT